MSTFIINVLDSVTGGAVENITLSCDFSIFYQNSKTLRILRSEVLLSTNATTDKNGNVYIDVTDLTHSREFTKYWELFVTEGYNGSFTISGNIKTYPNEKYLSLAEERVFDLSKISRDILYNSDKGYWQVPDMDANNSIYLVYLEDPKYSLTILEKNFKKVEKDYIFAKKQFYENLKVADTTDIFEKLTPYEPGNWKNVLTRLLEFEEGTLNAGLRFAKKTGLTEEYKRLDNISTAIQYIKNLYPDVTIKEGEGIPYNK